MPNPFTLLQQSAMCIRNVPKHLWRIIVSDEKHEIAQAMLEANLFVRISIFKKDNYIKVIVNNDGMMDIWTGVNTECIYDIDAKIAEYLENITKPIMLFPYLDVEGKVI